MKPEEQRIAIAETQGWVKQGAEKIWWNGSHYATLKELPDFLHDLNAMHEAEKTLDFKKALAYWHQLEKIILDSLKWEDGPLPFLCVNATAAQRAEAFLRTKGLWKD